MSILPSFCYYSASVPKAAVQKQSTPIWVLVSGKLGLKSWSNKYKLYQLKTLTAIKVLNSDCNPF